MEKLGIQYSTLTSGCEKDCLTNFSTFSLDETNLDSVVNQNAENFIQHLKSNRILSAKSLDLLTSGQVINGKQAFEIGVVDHLGGLFSAIELICEMTGKESLSLVPVNLPPPSSDILNNLKKVVLGG